jgi:hypothetical protein
MDREKPGKTRGSFSKAFNMIRANGRETDE